MKQLNEKEYEQLKEAFSAIVNLFYASEKDTFAKCSSFHIEPFHTHWDKKTVQEVIYQVRLYVGSWVIYPMEQALKMDRKKIELEERQNHKDAVKRKKEWMEKQKNK